MSQMGQVQQVMAPTSVQQAQTAVVSQIPTQVPASIIQPTAQVYQQVITPTGEVQNIPVSLFSRELRGWATYIIAFKSSFLN